MPRPLAAAIAIALWSTAAAAQQVGGMPVAGPGMGPLPLQPEPIMAGALHQTPADVKSANPARMREARHQQSIAAIRGDAGYLGGFFHGQPLAPSRQPPPDFAMPDFVTIIDAPFIQNNFGSPVSVATDGPATINAEHSPVAVNAGPGKQEQRVDSAVNIATGTGNTAKQQVVRR
jgi:hypothetical protein